MADRVLHVRLNTDSPYATVVTSLASGIVPCARVTVDLDPGVAVPNRTAMLTIRVPMKYVDLEVVQAEGAA